MALAGAVILQISALFLRAHKWQLLTRTLRDGTVGDHFKTLSVGCVINVLFPLRLGEFARAHLLGRRLLISRSAVFCTIMFERALDGLFLSIFFFVLGIGSQALTTTAAVTFFLSCAVAGILFMLYTENRAGIRLVAAISRVFNEAIQQKIQLTAWSAIHGTRLFLNGMPTVQYLLESGIMWACYLGSMGLSLYAIEGAFSAATLRVSLASLFAVGVPAGPGALGSYHYILVEALSDVVTSIGRYAVTSWIVATVPVLLIGIYCLLRSKDLQAGIFPKKKTSAPALAIYRSEQSSPDFLNFLKTYFGGLELSQLVGHYEIDGEVRFVRMLRGGSDALTILVWTKQGHRVRKISLLPFAEKLRYQFEWLRERKRHEEFPTVLDLKEDEGSIFMDMTFYPDYEPFYDFIHNNELERSKEILGRVVDFVAEDIHVDSEPTESRETLEHYLKVKVMEKVNDCLIYDPSLDKLFAYPTLVINGIECENFPRIIKTITDDDAVMRSLSTYDRTEIHGDLTVDNILVSKDKFKILDPNGENIVSDPLVEFSKLYQSLHSGYENLIRLERVEIEGNSIRFNEEVSSRYGELFRHLEGLLAGRFDDSRVKIIKFHEAVHFARMLPYRQRINQKTFPIFYAVMVRLFGEFAKEIKLQPDSAVRPS